MFRLTIAGRRGMGVAAAAILGFGLAQSAIVRAETPADQPVEIAPTKTAPDVAHTVAALTHQVYRLLVEVEGAMKGGTAFLVSGSRVIATNHHVIDKGTAYSVGYVGDKGSIKRIPLRVLAVFPQKDLALLEALDDLPGQPLPLSTEYPGTASDLFAIGFPAAADPQGALSWSQGDDETFFLPSVLKGYVSRVLTNRWFSSQLQHQTPIIPGYSGGPLIDNDGVVVGISTSIHKEANGISYGVLAADLADFITACGLPLRTPAKAGSRPPLQFKGMLPAPEAMNTHSIQKRATVAPADEAMLARGNTLLERGDIAAARLMFRYLADRRNLPEAYAGLAKTYDPIYLNHKKVLGVSGDAVKAKEFYEQAARLGNSELGSLSLGPGTASLGGCDNSQCKLVNSSNGPVVLCENTDPALSAKRISRQQ
ncbi:MULTISPECIES: serine protease [Rhodomicrobium]|uniref:S1 family peptidase n=1 Tax=Rhodomicrobium TaxID=1068 RepID=UPI00148253D7|nr:MULTISPECIES: serine protease [Rhodomicrobium]